MSRYQTPQALRRALEDQHQELATQSQILEEQISTGFQNCCGQPRQKS